LGDAKMTKYCIGLIGSKKSACFNKKKDRDKLSKMLKNRLSYNTWSKK
jgi:hypothetical protein